MKRKMIIFGVIAILFLPVIITSNVIADETQDDIDEKIIITIEELDEIYKALKDFNNDLAPIMKNAIMQTVEKIDETNVVLDLNELQKNLSELLDQQTDETKHYATAKISYNSLFNFDTEESFIGVGIGLAFSGKQVGIISRTDMEISFGKAYVKPLNSPEVTLSIGDSIKTGFFIVFSPSEDITFGYPEFYRKSNGIAVSVETTTQVSKTTDLIKNSSFLSFLQKFPIFKHIIIKKF